jgi:hypothetical protein
MNNNMANTNQHENQNKLDRLIKYGFGFIRLSILIFSMMYFDKDLNLNILLENHRYLFYILVASYGACVNVEIINPKLEIFLLILAAGMGFNDLRYDFTVLLYMTKTLIPDFFANKLDRGIWKFILISSISSVIACCYIFGSENSIFKLINIWIVLAITQLFCELGDEHLESYAFFRHRYSFEFSMFLVWMFFLPMSKFGDEERRFFYFDIIASLSYRFFGFILKFFNLDARKKKTE